LSRPSRLAAAAGVAVVAMAVIGASFLMATPAAQAIPAFARKYDLTCHACHTRPPRLNTYGERFLENGYQLPGTEDGGTTKKKKLGDLTLDDVTNYVGVRLRGNVAQYVASSSASDDKEQFAFPEIFSVFTAGTLARNVGFFVELESNLGDGETGIERAFISFNNLGGHNLAHVRVGRFDPSAFWSYPTLRQQMEDVSGDVTNPGGFAAPTFNRIALHPGAFGAKFSGLFTPGGSAIEPQAASLFNGPAETGLDIHGRPFGDGFLYQVGVLNGGRESFGDSNKGKDVYAMMRLDAARSKLFSASLSAMGYLGNSNAKLGTQQDVNWSRYGVAANVRYQMVDLYGAFVIDRITNLPAGTTSFDATASGLTVQADVLATNRTLLSARYDNIDAGGVLAKRTSNSLIGFQAKQYVRPNIALSLREDVNVREERAGAERAFRHATMIGLDVAF
jgi:hypothetical protein